MPCGYTEACVPGGLPAVLQQSTEPQSCGPEQRKLHGPALSLGVPRWKDLGTSPPQILLFWGVTERKFTLKEL